MSDQVSKKRGKRSTAKKRAASRHDFDPIPATSPVPGAFGRRGRGARKGKTSSRSKAPRGSR